MSQEADLSPNQALEAAIARAGSQSALARLIDSTQGSVWRWVQAGQVLSADHVIPIERATGVSRHDLRPDLYPRDSAPAADRDAA